MSVFPSLDNHRPEATTATLDAADDHSTSGPSHLWWSNVTATATAERSGHVIVVHRPLALLLLVFPALTVFGNVLVCLSVVREQNLRTLTNYFIVSLAVADIMVAILVMPFGVYVEVGDDVNRMTSHFQSEARFRRRRRENQIDRRRCEHGEPFVVCWIPSSSRVVYCAL